jgi:hypothetical protein
VPVPSPLLVVLAVLAAVALGALGTYALSSALVMGGRTAEWLESHRWVYAVALGAGLAGLGAGVLVPVLPLASLGAALALVGASRYVWLNV